MTKLTFIKENLVNRFEQLTIRERRLILTLGVALSLFVVGGLVIGIGGSIGSRRTQLRALEKQIAEINALKGNYLQAKIAEDRQTQQIQRNTLSLFSVVQNVAGRYGLQLSDLKETKKPLPESKWTEVSVVVNLKQLSIDRLAAFIEAVEQASPEGLLKITRLTIKTRFDSPDLLDAQMTISTWKAA